MIDSSKKIIFQKGLTQDGGCPDFARIVKESTPDESLFRQIAECFSGRLKSFAKYVCKDETKGQDAFQDAMIAAMTYLDTYRGVSPIEPWLRRIVVTACSRQRRGKKNDENLNRSMESLKGELPDNAAGPDQELIMMLKERLDLVQDEISSLREPDRSLLELHDIQETPITDLASRFELSTEAVKSRLKRARATVRDNLMDRL